MTKTMKAIIYVRGHKQEMQEIFCRVYAIDKGYKVLYTTSNIKDVNGCDVLLVANHSRISRNKFEYYKIMSILKMKKIKVESVSDQDNVEECLWLTEELLKV